MEADSLFPSEFTNYEYIYNNEDSIAQLQVPLAISYFNIPKFANELYTDTDTTYFTYSGEWSSLIVSREKDGRYKNLSMRAYSGDSFKFYFSTGLGFSSGANYYSGPLTTSGVYSKLTLYSGEAAAITNAITFSAPDNNLSVYTLPYIENINWIRLHHKEAVSGEPYRLYQFLPRTLIQVDDLEADVIDAVTIRVSGSIVVSADNLAPGSITGDKIMNGTVSGVLITPGGITATQIASRTITANQIAVSGITADLLSVTQLDAVAAKMGNLIVNSGISVGTNGYIAVPSGYISAGLAKLDSTGLQIGSVSSSNLPSITDTLRISGSGVGGNIVGMALYNGAFSASNPQSVIQLDSTNALEIEMRAPSGLINFNFPDTIAPATPGFTSIYNGSLNFRRNPGSTSSVKPGGIYGYDAAGNKRYELSADQLVLNNASSDVLSISASSGGITTSGGISAGGDISTLNNVNVDGSVIADFAVKAGTQLDAAFDGVSAYRFRVDGSGGLNLDGGIFAGTANNKFTVAAATGNTTVAGTLGVTGALTASNNVLQYNYGGLYKNTAQNINAGADAKITFQVSYTNGTLDSVANSRLTTVYAGFYVISAGVISTAVGSIWQVVTGGAIGSGVQVAGVIQNDMRAYTTKIVYLAAGVNLELWVRNSGGATIPVTTGANGTVLTATKVG